MAAARRTGIDHAAHESRQRDRIETLVFELDPQVVGPGAAHLAAEVIAEVERVHPVVIDGLSLLQQLDATIDA